MQIWPAIDLRGGKCVRLRQGDYPAKPSSATIRPRWPGTGSKWGPIACTWSISTAPAMGGPQSRRRRAIRPRSTCLASWGAASATSRPFANCSTWGSLVLGSTKALASPMVSRMCREFPGRLVLGLDARDGRWRRMAGWRRAATRRWSGAASGRRALAAIVYTDIANDGMLAGPNFAGLAEMRDARRSAGHRLGRSSRSMMSRDWPPLGLGGCVIGRALYEGTNSRLRRGSGRGRRRESTKINWGDSAGVVLSMITRQEGCWHG